MGKEAIVREQKLSNQKMWSGMLRLVVVLSFPPLLGVAKFSHEVKHSPTRHAHEQRRAASVDAHARVLDGRLEKKLRQEHYAHEDGLSSMVEKRKKRGAMAKDEAKESAAAADAAEDDSSDASAAPSPSSSSDDSGGGCCSGDDETKKTSNTASTSSSSSDDKSA